MVDRANFEILLMYFVLGKPLMLNVKTINVFSPAVPISIY